MTSQQAELVQHFGLHVTLPPKLGNLVIQGPWFVVYADENHGTGTGSNHFTTHVENIVLLFTVASEFLSLPVIRPVPDEEVLHQAKGIYGEPGVEFLTANKLNPREQEKVCQAVRAWRRRFEQIPFEGFPMPKGTKVPSTREKVQSWAERLETSRGLGSSPEEQDLRARVVVEVAMEICGHFAKPPEWDAKINRAKKKL